MPFDANLTRVFLSVRSGLARAVSGIVPPKEIEDVVQETYVRVCQTRNGDEIRSPRSFMYRTARNIALNYVNEAASRLVDSIEDVQKPGRSVTQDANSDTLARVCSDEEFSFFCDAVRSLPLQCRRAFVLKKVYGHSYKEIAETLQITEKTVEKHIAKGITRCRNYLNDRVNSQGNTRRTFGGPGGRA